MTYDPIGEQAKQELAEVLSDDAVPAQVRGRSAERVLAAQEASHGTWADTQMGEPFVALTRSAMSAVFEFVVLNTLQHIQLPPDTELMTEFRLPDSASISVVDAALRSRDDGDVARMVAIETVVALTATEITQRTEWLRHAGFGAVLLVVPRRRNPRSVNFHNVRVVEFGEGDSSTFQHNLQEVDDLATALQELWDLVSGVAN